MKTIQYTIRGVPARLDELLRARAVRDGRSMNAELLDALERGIGYDRPPEAHHDLDDLVGTWVEDPEFDKAILEMDRIDEGLWK